MVRAQLNATTGSVAGMLGEPQNIVFATEQPMLHVGQHALCGTFLLI
jgi:hypothetical protein